MPLFANRQTVTPVGISTTGTFGTNRTGGTATFGFSLGFHGFSVGSKFETGSGELSDRVHNESKFLLFWSTNEVGVCLTWKLCVSINDAK